MSTTTTPASASSFSGGGSPQSISNRRPPTSHSASWNRPPREPLPWTWTCHECRTSWPLAITRRCLRCDHKFCDSHQQAANSSTSSRKRKRSGSCKTSFDYMGWAARGAWRRTLLLNAKDDKECDSRLLLATSSPSSHKMTLRSSKQRVGETAPTISSTTNSSRPALEQHAADQNNLPHDTPDENGILASNNRWLTPHSLSCAWGDEHNAVRRRNEAQLVGEFNPQREALFVRRLHNCWLHCDFPSECRTVAMQARAEGRPVGQEAKEVDECYLKEQRRKIRRLEESHGDGGGETRTSLPSSRPNGRWGQPMDVQEWSSDDDDDNEDEDEDEDEEDKDWFSSSSSSTDDDFKDSSTGVTLWQSYKSTGNKLKTTDDAIDRATEQISTIVSAEEYDSDDERSPTSPSRPASGYIGPKLPIVNVTSISNSHPASSYQSFSIPPPFAPTTRPAVPMEAKLDLPSPRDVDTRSTSGRSLPTISEEEEDGQSAHNESEDEVQIFLESLFVDVRRTTRETGRIHGGVQLASSGEPLVRCSSRQTSQTTFESFPSFEHQQSNDKGGDQSRRGKNDKDDQDEVEDEAEFDRQLRQAYSEKSWYPETHKDVSESGSAKKKKTRQYRRTVVRHQRTRKVLTLLRRRIEGVAGSGTTPSTRSSSPSEGIDMDGAVESLTDDSNTSSSSRTSSPPIELDVAVIESDGFKGLGEFEDEDLETLGYIQPSSVAGGGPWGSRVLGGVLSTSTGLKNCEVVETTTMIVNDDL